MNPRFIEYVSWVIRERGRMSVIAWLGFGCGWIHVDFLLRRERKQKTV